MRSIKVKDLRFCPVYIPRNEKNEPLFYIEFLEPTYSLINDSFFNENTIMTIHSALDYSQSAVINDTKFDFDELNEIYDSEKMYAKSYIEDRLKKAPRYIKKYMKELDEFEKDGKIFVKIPQVLYQYLFGGF